MNTEEPSPFSSEDLWEIFAVTLGLLIGIPGTLAILYILSEIV